MNFARRIRRLRLECGLSQEEFAKKIGVPVEKVISWENASSKPDMNTIKIMSEIFNKDVDYIIYGSHKSNDYFDKAIDIHANRPNMHSHLHHEKRRYSKASRMLMTGTIMLTIGVLGVLVFVYLSQKNPWTAFYKNVSINGLLGYVLATQSVFAFGLCIVFILFALIIFVKYLIHTKK